MKINQENSCDKCVHFKVCAYKTERQEIIDKTFDVCRGKNWGDRYQLAISCEDFLTYPQVVSTTIIGDVVSYGTDKTTPYMPNRSPEGIQREILCDNVITDGAKTTSNPYGVKGGGYCNMSRVSWDEYFMNIAEMVKTRSTCMRRQVGAVIVKDKQIVATGYNGAPTGLAHCTEIGYCERNVQNIPSGQRAELCRANHAEANAVAQAAKLGVSVDRATIYVTTHPCVVCAKLLINAGIERIVYKGDYPDELSKKILDEACIAVVKMED